MKKNKSERVVKRNKKKIIIWSTVFVVLATGISLTLYFVLRGSGKQWPENLTELSLQEAIDRTNSYDDENLTEDDIWGLYIGSSDFENGCQHCREAIYGETNPNEDTAPDGEFSIYLKDANMPWFSVEAEDINKANENVLDFFRGINPDADGEPQDFGYTAPLVYLPSSDEDMESDLLRGSTYVQIVDSNQVIVDLNAGDLITNSIFLQSTDEEGETTETSSLAIPAFIWMKGSNPIAMSIGFAPKSTDEEGNETIPQTSNMFFAAEDYLFEWVG